MLNLLLDLLHNPWVILGLLLVMAAAAGYFYWLAPHWWAKRDARDFSVDPTNDTFHDKFHRQRVTWRAAFCVLLGLVAALPWSLCNWAAYGAAAAAYAVSGGGYFAFAFNHLLSKARNLDYVHENYVSQDPDAANPDAWIWRQVLDLLGDATSIAAHEGFGSPTIGQLVAGLLLELLSYAILIYSQTVALGLLIIAIILAAA